MNISRKVKFGAGALLATLTLGAGAVAAAGPQLSAAAGAATGDRQARCQAFQDQFAKNLGISAQQLQDTRKLTANQLIDQQLAAGTITADQAAKLHDKVNSSTSCQNAGHGKAKAAIQHVRKTELQAVAQKLGITEQALVKELRGGKSLAQVAQTHGVSPADLKATMRDALKADLDKAVQAGTITQAQEDKALAAFDKRIDTIINRTGQGKQR